MTQQDPRHILVQVTKVLNRLKIPYIVTGGIAVLDWKYLRQWAAKLEVLPLLEKSLPGGGKLQ